MPPADSVADHFPEGLPFEAMFLASPVPASVSRERDGLLMAVNDAWVSLTGLRRADVIGHTTVELGHWLNDEARQAFVRRLAEQPGVQEVTMGMGEVRHMRLHTTRMDLAPDPLLLVYFYDITAQKKAEQALQEANLALQQRLELYAALEKLAAVGHWTNAADEEPVFWSEGLRALTGMAAHRELTRELVRSRIHPDDREAWYLARQAMDGRTVEFRWQRPDNDQFLWLRTRMARTAVAGNPQTDFGVVQDVTAEKQTLDTLAEQARFIRSIAARVPGIIYLARLRPDGHSEIPFVNDAVRDLLELEPEELRHDARPLFGRIHPDDLPAVQAALQNSARTLVPWRQMYRAVLPRRGLRWFRVEAVPHRESDGAVLWHGFTTDVTDSHLASQKLQRQHRMLEAIQTAQALFIEARSRREAFDGLLAAFLSVTGSAYGFIGEVLYDEAGQPYLRTYAMTDIAWDDASRAMYARHDQSGVEFRNLQTLFGQALVTGQPLIANHPAQDPRSGGLPAGHLAMQAFLGVPLAVDDRLVAMVGLANQPGGYSETDIEFLRPLLGAVRQLVVAWRQRVAQASTREQLESTSAELARQSEALRVTLDSMSQGISQVDASRRMVVYNRRLMELLDLPESLMASGPTHEEIVAFQTRRGDFGPDMSLIDDPLVRQYVSRLDARKVPERYLRKTKDGQTLEIRTRTLDNGGMVRTYSDVTPFVNAQEALHRERQRLAWVLEATRPGIWEFDHQAQVFKVDDRWADMLGYTVQELEPLTEHTWRRLTHPEDLPRMEQALRDHLAGMTRYYECDIRMLHKDGRWIWINDRARVHERSEDGAALYMSGTHLDITDRVQAQEEVRALNATLEERVRERTWALERSMRDMETISYSIAHDLRAPLRAVNGFASLIADEGVALDPVSQDMFRRISRASRNMGQMITDMLELLRVVRVELATLPVDMPLLAREAADSLAPGLAPGEMDITDMPRVLGDPTLLRQVLVNLIDNAIKYAQPGARPMITFGYERSARAFFLRDQGVGFDMTRAHKLFGLFQRLHIAGEIPGTGVGLAIVARIVERHGGRIWAESQPGVGTTFWWTLPIIGEV